MFGKALPRIPDAKKIEDLLSRCVAEILPSKDALRQLLLSGKKLRIKLGIDPTSPNIHLGRTVPLLKLRDFQELGHQIVFIVGDFTATIGDTSDKEAERPMLTEEAVRNNLATYRAQVGKILDLSKTEFKHNSEWLTKLRFEDVAKQADLFSVSDFISRENVKRRLDSGKRVSLREVLYPLMQGYDSVAIRADVEIGGQDQRFNILAGRPLQEYYGQPPQSALLLSLITSPDGRKMSSSWGNTVNVSDIPADMFGKVMAIPDDFIEPYFTHATRVPLTQIKVIMAGHPKDAKFSLARELVRMYHGEDAAEKSGKSFDAIFSKKVVNEIDAKPAPFNSGQTYLDALVLGGFVQSRSEVRRLASSKALFSVTRDTPVTDVSEEPRDGEILRIGKHRIAKMVRS